MPGPPRRIPRADGGGRLGRRPQRVRVAWVRGTAGGSAQTPRRPPRWWRRRWTRRWVPAPPA